MNILFLDTYYKGLYGAPKSMLSLAQGLYQKHHSITIASTKNDTLLSTADKLNLNTISLNTPEILLTSRRKQNLLSISFYFFYLMYYWFKQLRYNSHFKLDVICVNDIRAYLLFFPLLFLNRRRVVWYVRINDRVSFISHLAVVISNKIILISSDCYECFSDKEKAKYKNKFSIVNTGFDFSHDEINYDVEINHADMDVVFVSVGSLCERKNQISILNAFNSLEMDNKHLYLLGSAATDADKEYERKIKKIIIDNNISDKVSLIPHTPFVMSYLSLSDCFLFASHKEGLPRVIIESLYSGCFVISSRVDGITDILTDNKLGIITESFASDFCFQDDFELAIKQALKSHQVFRSKLNKHSNRNIRKEYIERNFSFEKFLINFISVIE
ncbi:glycosyltransferase [Vibrio breoganii]